MDGLGTNRATPMAIFDSIPIRNASEMPSETGGPSANQATLMAIFDSILLRSVVQALWPSCIDPQFGLEVGLGPMVVPIVHSLGFYYSHFGLIFIESSRISLLIFFNLRESSSISILDIFFTFI